MAFRHSEYPSDPQRYKIEQALDAALVFLHHSQLPHGEFKTQAAENAAMTKNCVCDSSPFSTAFVLYSISFENDARIEAMTAKGLKFLQAEMEGRGLWRYWSSRNDKHYILPPDLDDTACVSYILEQHNFASDNHDFLIANRRDDDLFYTWLAPRSGMPAKLKTEIRRLTRGSSLPLFSISGTLNNVDPAVNANVLLYLGECDETRPAIRYLVTSMNNANSQIDSYYADPMVFYYLVSRAYYRGVNPLIEASKTIRKALLARRKMDGSFGNALLTALAVCTGINFGQPRDTLMDSVNCLLQTQKRSGAWQLNPMWLGPAPFYGSEELTTALCFEALSRYIS